MDLEEQWAIALGVLSILLLGGGVIFARVISGAPARVIRTVVPIAVLVTFAIYATFVAIARSVVK